VLLLVVCLTATACGGKKATSATSTESSTATSTGSSTSSRSSSAQFVAQANALCGQSNAKITRLWASAAQVQNSGGTVHAVLAVRERIASVADQYNVKLRALEPPSKQAAAYAQFLAAYERQASKMHKLVKSSGAVKVDVFLGGTMAVTLPAAAEPDRAKSDRIGQSLGLNACTGSTSGGALTGLDHFKEVERY
jgi:hypothetical protein